MNDQTPINVTVDVVTGPGWTFWAILLSAVVALFSIAAQRVATKRRAALDLIIRSENESYQKYTSIFDDLVRHNALDTILTPASGEDYDKRKSVQELLNHYELIAIAIEQNIVDEEIVKRYQRFKIINDWKSAKSTIEEVRKAGSPTIYIYTALQELAEKWEKNPRIEVGRIQKFRRLLKELFPI